MSEGVQELEGEDAYEPLAFRAEQKPVTLSTRGVTPSRSHA
jgi:hypothetical protein